MYVYVSCTYLSRLLSVDARAARACLSLYPMDCTIAMLLSSSSLTPTFIITISGEIHIKTHHKERNEFGKKFVRKEHTDE